MQNTAATVANKHRLQQLLQTNPDCSSCCNKHRLEQLLQTNTDWSSCCKQTQNAAAVTNTHALWAAAKTNTETLACLMTVPVSKDACVDADESRAVEENLRPNPANSHQLGAVL